MGSDRTYSSVGIMSVGETDGVSVIDKLAPQGISIQQKAQWAYDDVQANHMHREVTLSQRNYSLTKFTSQGA